MGKKYREKNWPNKKCTPEKCILYTAPNFFLSVSDATPWVCKFINQLGNRNRWVGGEGIGCVGEDRSGRGRGGGAVVGPCPVLYRQVWPVLSTPGKIFQPLQLGKKYAPNSAVGFVHRDRKVERGE